MSDPTEAIRREMVSEINRVPGSREDLESQHGVVWDTDEMCAEFSALGFAAPFIMVRRQADNVRGSLMFQHNPRFYFNFVEG